MMASKQQYSTGVHRTWPNKDCIHRPYGWHLDGGALHACCHGKGCRVLDFTNLGWHPYGQGLHTGKKWLDAGLFSARWLQWYHSLAAYGHLQLTFPLLALHDTVASPLFS